MEALSAFMAYRHSGEDPEVLRPMLEGVQAALTRRDISSYCTFFSEGQFKDSGLSRRQP